MHVTGLMASSPQHPACRRAMVRAPGRARGPSRRRQRKPHACQPQRSTESANRGRYAMRAYSRE